MRTMNPSQSWPRRADPHSGWGVNPLDRGRVGPVQWQAHVVIRGIHVVEERWKVLAVDAVVA